MTKEQIIVSGGTSWQPILTKEEFLECAAAQYERIEYSRTMNCNMTDLENLGYELAVILGRKLLEIRLANDSRTDPNEPAYCPKCGWKWRIQNPKQERPLKTILGEIAYERPYCVCDRCGCTGAPMDLALGIPARGPSVNVLQRSCHAAVIGRSFNDGKEILKVHSGLDFSRKNLRSISEKEGRLLVEERTKQVQRFEQGKQDVISKEKPQLIVVGADGGRVQTRDRQEPWKEDKIGVVYDAIPQPQPVDVLDKDYAGAKARIKTYVATMQNWESLGWMLCMEAFKRGYQAASEKAFLADGAPHIREVKNLHFPDAIFILDWAHAAEHLNECAKAAFGQGTPKAQAWYQEQKQLLWDGKVMEIIRELEKISNQLGKPSSEDSDSSSRRILFRNAYSYFPNNSDAMDYPAYRVKGWPIGSGVAESAIKQFARRLKGSEKFWNISNIGAEEMLALCALYYSEDGRWDRYWIKRAQPFR